MEENKLDFTNNGQLTLDDLDFGTPEIVEPTTPEVVAPVIDDTVTPAAEEVKDAEAPTLDDLNFDGEEGEEVEEPKQKRLTKDLKLEAVKAVLKKKLERYEIEADADIDTMDEEALADFEEQLDQAVLDTKWNSIKGSDKNLDKLLSYIENGGDPTKIVGLFQEQKELAKIDITTEEGQAKLIKSYYKDVLGWSEEKVNNKVDRLAAAGQLNDEVQDVKDAYDTHFEEEQERQLKIQEEKAQREQNILEQKRLMFEKTLTDSRIPKKLQDEYKQVAFGKGILKGSSEKIDILDYKILQLQNKPETFLKLVQFVSDPDAYDALVMTAKQNAIVTKETKKGFQFQKNDKQTDNVSLKNKENGKTQYSFKF